MNNLQFCSVYQHRKINCADVFPKILTHMHTSTHTHTILITFALLMSLETYYTSPNNPAKLEEPALTLVKLIKILEVNKMIWPKKIIPTVQ